MNSFPLNPRGCSGGIAFVLRRGRRGLFEGGRVIARARVLVLILAAGLAAEGAAGAAGQQDTPEDQQAHAEEDGLPGPSAGGSAREKAGMDLRPRMEGEEELPAEFEPEQVVPFDQSRIGLPGWQEADRLGILRRRRPANQGGGLFPPEFWPIQPVAPVPASDAGRQEDGGGPPPTGVLAQPVLDLYFARRPDRVFCDPQHLLSAAVGDEMESRMRRWLNLEGPFRATILLFGPGQQLPASVDARSVLKQWTGGGARSLNHLLIFYYFDEPGRTTVTSLEAAAGRIPAAGLAEAMAASVRAAGRVEGGLPQLERFCYKSTIHLHRLAEARPAGGPRSGKSPVRAWRTGILAGAGLAAAAALVLALVRRGQRRKSGEAKDRRDGGRTLPAPVLLPEQDLYPRLSAPHAGGLASVITFTARKHE